MSPLRWTAVGLLVVSAGACAVEEVQVGNTGAPLDSIALSPSSLQLSTGDTIRVTASGFSASTGEAMVQPTWASVDPRVASIDESGLVVGVEPGSTILAAALDGLATAIPVVVVEGAAQPQPPEPPARMITFDFTGYFDSFEGEFVRGFQGRQVAFRGSYTFDPTVTDSDAADPGHGSYVSRTTGTDIRLAFDGFEASMTAGREELVFDVTDGTQGSGGDIYSVASSGSDTGDPTWNVRGDLGFPGAWLCKVRLEVAKLRPANLLADDALPTTPPDVTDRAAISTATLMCGLWGSASAVFRGVVESLTLR